MSDFNIKNDAFHENGDSHISFHDNASDIIDETHHNLFGLGKRAHERQMEKLKIQEMEAQAAIDTAKAKQMQATSDATVGTALASAGGTPQAGGGSKIAIIAGIGILVVGGIIFAVIKMRKKK